MSAGSATDITTEALSVEQDGRVLLARFDDPPANYMDRRLLHELDMLTAAVECDGSVGAVVLTGGSSGRFITHFDVAEMLEGTERAGRSFSKRATLAGLRVVEVARRLPAGERALDSLPVAGVLSMRRFAEVSLRIRRSGAVYVAAINGICAGGGMELALSFDLRIAADGAMLGLPELLLGLTTSVSGQRLAQLLGPARALRLLLDGSLLAADEALELGLVDEVVVGHRLLDAARSRAKRYARRNRAAVAAQKRILYEDALRPADDGLRREAAASLAAISSEPVRRALRAFVAQERAAGDSPFLSHMDAWQEGRAFD